MKVAVICALNIDKNPGMVTVDRAAKQFFTGRRLELDWLVAGSADRHNPGVEDMGGFRPLFEESGYPEKYDRIIFWGDFLQSQVHHRALIPSLLSSGYAADPDEALLVLRRFLLLEGATSELLQRVAIIGSTIHADNADALIDDSFRKSLARLLSHACCVRMREPVSAYRASILSGRDGTVGMDAAFLAMRGRAWNLEAQHNRNIGPLRIAVVGGRSDVNLGRKLKFAALATQQSFRRRGVTAVLEVLPWLSESLGRWGFFNVENPSNNRHPDYCLERLANCDALVTDVYHAAVNAWVLGIPVVLLGRGAEVDTSAIKSKKKELLALSLFASENYVFFETIRYFRFCALGDKLWAILNDDLRNSRIFEIRKMQVIQLTQQLEAELNLPVQS